MLLLRRLFMAFACEKPWTIFTLYTYSKSVHPIKNRNTTCSTLFNRFLDTEINSAIIYFRSIGLLKKKNNYYNCKWFELTFGWFSEMKLSEGDHSQSEKSLKCAILSCNWILSSFQINGFNDLIEWKSNKWTVNQRNSEASTNSHLDGDVREVKVQLTDCLQITNFPK